MSYDEQPDDDPHGQCWNEIEHLRRLLGQCYTKLMKFGIQNSDPFLMDEIKLTLMQSVDMPAPTFADGMTEEDDKSFLRHQQDELRRADFEEEMRLDAFGSKHE